MSKEKIYADFFFFCNVSLPCIVKLIVKRSSGKYQVKYIHIKRGKSYGTVQLTFKTKLKTCLGHWHGLYAPNTNVSLYEM